MKLPQRWTIAILFTACGLIAATAIAAPSEPWWRSSELVSQLQLSGDQLAALEDAYLDYRLQAAEHQARSDAEQARLDHLLRQHPVDLRAAQQQSDRAVDANGAVDEADAQWLLTVRSELTTNQWQQLDQLYRRSRPVLAPTVAAPMLRVPSPSPVSPLVRLKASRLAPAAPVLSRQPPQPTVLAEPPALSAIPVLAPAPDVPVAPVVPDAPAVPTPEIATVPRVMTQSVRPQVAPAPAPAPAPRVVPSVMPRLPAVPRPKVAPPAVKPPAVKPPAPPAPPAPPVPLLPTGAWWQDDQVRHQLELSARQVENIETTVSRYSTRLLDLRQRYLRAERALRPLVSAEALDLGEVKTRLRTVQRSRSELEKVNRRLKIEIRQLLTPSQSQRLDRSGLAPSPSTGQQG